MPNQPRSQSTVLAAHHQERMRPLEEIWQPRARPFFQIDGRKRARRCETRWEV
uniref:Uncharacterized protein n=1 Tax=Triticum urartu TaxID=4572 RepID=A0A8R7Q7L4_TRIUA